MRLKASAASLFVVLATVTAPSPTHGAEEDIKNVEHLLAWCKQPEASAEHAFCVGFVDGTADMMGMVAVNTHGDFRMHYGMCSSNPYPSVNAEVQAFILWAEKNPKVWGMPNEVGVILALADTWPCTADGKAAK